MRKYALMFSLLLGCGSGLDSSPLNQGGSNGSGGNQESGGSFQAGNSGGSDQGGSSAGGSISQGGNGEGNSAGTSAGGSSGSSAGGSTPTFTKATVQLIAISPPGANPPFKAGGTINLSVVKGGIPSNLQMDATLGGCTLPYYSLFIISGSTCPGPNKTSQLWDGMRGTSTTMMMCDQPRTYYHGDGRPGLQWTIGDGGPSDIIGHPMILVEYHNPPIYGALACGIIQGL